MKPSLLLLASLLLAIIQPVSARADTAELLEQIKQITSEESKSAEELLARIWPIAEQVYDASEWYP